MQNNLKICFIGGGNMAQALIGGLAGKLTAAANIHVVDVNPDALAALSAQFGVQTSSAPGSEVAAADVLVLAVKPQQMHAVVSNLVPHMDGQLVLSIAAGIRAVDLSRWLNGHQAIVRTMPNTPALIGKGVTGMTASAGVTPEQRATADAILKAVGFSGKDVNNIFISIALSIGIFGGLMGLLMGFGLSSLIDQIPFNTESLPTIKTYPINYNPKFYLIGGTFAIVTTYFAGFFPSRKASGIDPVIIIRGK